MLSIIKSRYAASSAHNETGITAMPTIELSQQTFDRLKELAEPLVDTPDTVVHKLLEAYLAGG